MFRATRKGATAAIRRPPPPSHPRQPAKGPETRADRTRPPCSRPEACRSSAFPGGRALCTCRPASDGLPDVGGISGYGGLILRVSHHFIDRGDAFEHEPPPILPQALHAVLHGSLADGVRRGALEHQRANLVVEQHHLEDAASPAIPAPLALAAP